MVQSGVVKLFPDNPAIMNQALQFLAHLGPIDWNCSIMETITSFQLPMSTLKCRFMFRSFDPSPLRISFAELGITYSDLLLRTGSNFQDLRQS